VIDAFVAAGTVDGLDTSCVRDGVPGIHREVGTAA
jgi:hypothetical protein